MREGWDEFSNRVYESYRDSPLYKIFGTETPTGGMFRNLTRARLKSITGLTGIGKFYLDLMESMIGVDSLVSEAFGEKPLNIIFDYSTAYNDRGIDLEKDRSLHVDIGANKSPLSLISIKSGVTMPDLPETDILYDYYRRGSENPFKDYAYVLLDQLLHLRTHLSLMFKEGRHRISLDDRLHAANFLEEKSRLRRIMVDYLEEKGIDLTDYVRQYFPQVSGDDRFTYGVSYDELSSLVHTPLRGLLYENRHHERYMAFVKKGKEEEERLRETKAKNRSTYKAIPIKAVDT